MMILARVPADLAGATLILTRTRDALLKENSFRKTLKGSANGSRLRQNQVALKQIQCAQALATAQQLIRTSPSNCLQTQDLLGNNIALNLTGAAGNGVAAMMKHRAANHIQRISVDRLTGHLSRLGIKRQAIVTRDLKQ